MGFSADRPPVVSYDQALWWLVRKWGDNWQAVLSEALPLEAQLVVDIFWVNESQLRAQLTKRCRELDASVRPRLLSRSRRGSSWGR